MVVRRGDLTAESGNLGLDWVTIQCRLALVRIASEVGFDLMKWCCNGPQGVKYLELMSTLYFKSKIGIYK